MITPLKEKYVKEVIPKMKEKFSYKNNMAVPKIAKVVVNVGFGRRVAGKSSEERRKIQESVAQEIALITGQRPMLRKAKKSISSFKIRMGMAIGAAATLRGQKMYDFLDRLVNVGLPRSRDFNGIDPKAVDEGGNLSIGIKEHIAFPEISPEKIKEIFGFEVTVVTTAKTREESLELFKLLGFPIKD